MASYGVLRRVHHGAPTTHSPAGGTGRGGGRPLKVKEAAHRVLLPPSNASFVGEVQFFQRERFGRFGC